MARWTDDDPGVFWSGSTSTDNDRFADSLTTIGEVHDAYQANADLLTEAVWTGEAADAWRDSAEAVVSRIATLKSTVDPVTTAISTYAGTVAQIQTEATYWVQELADAERRQNGSYVTNSPPSQEELDRIQQQQDQADQDASTARRQVEQLATRRREADDALVSVIQSALPSSWADQRAALAAVGIRNVDDLRTADIRQTMQDIAQGIADGEEPDPDDLAALAAYLELYGEDETQMSMFFLGLGGAATVGFLGHLGQALYRGNTLLGEPGSQNLIEAWRRSLSVASQNWTADEAHPFATSMITGAEHGPELAYLFGDPDGALMGEELTLSAAIELDRMARVDGHGIPVENNGFGWLTGDPANLRTDPAGTIFSSLARYPDSALSFLSDSGPTSDLGVGGRLEFWYGFRQWPESEHWQGPAELWFGAMGAGEAPPGAGSAAEAQSGISAVILHELANSPYFSEVFLNEQSSAAFGAAISLNWQGLMETPVTAGIDGLPSDSGGSWDYAAWVDSEGNNPFGDGTIPIPQVLESEFRDVLGTLSHFDSANIVLADGMQHYVESVVNSAAPLEPGQSPQTDLGNRIIAAQAVLDGAGITERLAAAQAEDATTDAAIQGVVTIASAFPFGSLVSDGASFMIRWGGNLVQGQLIASGGAAVDGIAHHALGSSEARFLAEYWSSENGDRVEQANMSAASAIYDYLAASAQLPPGQPLTLEDGTPVPPPPVFDADATDGAAALSAYNAAREEWFTDNRDLIESFVADSGGFTQGFNQMETNYNRVADVQ
ncbi:hypothetical protein [Schumannella sp. 10F1B-5-1]|uniref:hypothetical protein n=1 Tax=Schumannella sp. 10F1B-5-1 TaxID=2590780 RepID=UPI0011300F31|nr:hypothetical protein [Schumannella sp. 10F1B-5-1]TPW73514.1 hypothetical protein FJ658_04835 [Schumannella sp. 10F1B-5-1]